MSGDGEMKTEITSKIGIKKTKHFQLQACVPIEVLKHLGADNGDIVEWVLCNNCIATVKKIYGSGYKRKGGLE